MNIATGGGTLVHEIVHPFMAANCPTCPAWFNEGLGSLYERCAERHGHIVGLPNWRLTQLQSAIRSGTGVFRGIEMTRTRLRESIRAVSTAVRPRRLGVLGTLLVAWLGLAAGAYRLVGRATLDGRAVEEQATFVLRPEVRELDDVVSRDEVLRQIAAVTGGEFRAGTLGTPAIRPARQVRVGNLRTVALWSHPLLLFLAVGLLASEWLLCRRAGHG